MPTRRTFLQGSLVVTTLALPTSMRAALAAGLPSLQIIVDQQCADTALFAAHCTHVAAVGADPSALLPGLNGGLAGVDVLFGLTRASHQFLFEQLAVPLGYRLAYRGIHDYRSGRLRHDLSGQAAIVPAAARTLHASAERWPAVLAGSVALLARSAVIDHTTMLASAVGRPADSPAYLVSWCLRRA